MTNTSPFEVQIKRLGIFQICDIYSVYFKRVAIYFPKEKHHLHCLFGK